jgi:hypothetical protein
VAVRIGADGDFKFAKTKRISKLNQVNKEKPTLQRSPEFADPGTRVRSTCNKRKEFGQGKRGLFRGSQ